MMYIEVLFWKKKYSENLVRVLEKCLQRSSVFSKVAVSKSETLLKMKSFTGLFQRFCLVFREL